MNIKDSVSSFELSKKLKEVGAIQKSYWWWVFILNKWKLVDKKEKRRLFSFCEHKDEINYNKVISAFTVAESGERLPQEIEHKKYGRLSWQSYKFYYKEERILQYINRYQRTNITYLFIKADTEANSRAKMRIYLLKNKIIKEE